MALILLFSLLLFSNFLIPLSNLSLNLIISLHSDKKFSNFSFILVTSFCNVSIKSFSFSYNCLCFNSNDLLILLNIESYELFIFIISYSIFPFKLLIFSFFSLNSLVVKSNVKFSFFNDSSSSINIIL